MLQFDTSSVNPFTNIMCFKYDVQLNSNEEDNIKNAYFQTKLKLIPHLGLMEV